MPSLSVCVVVPVRNRLDLTKKFLESFKTTKYNNYQIVIVDDGSTDNTVKFLTKNYPDVTVLRGDGSLFWTGATNLGVKYALEQSFDYILTINNDSVVNSKTLSNLVHCSKTHPNSIVGSLILRGDNRNIWSAGITLSWEKGYLFTLNYFDQPISILKNKPNPLSVDTLNGNGTLIPASLFQRFGLYNEVFTPHYHADSEIVLRATKNGMKALVCLDATLLNDIRTEPLNNGRRELIFAKKSDYYWKPLLYFYLKYAPKGHRNGFFRQYYHFFKEYSIVRTIGKLYDRIFLKGRFTNGK